MHGKIPPLSKGLILKEEKTKPKDINSWRNIFTSQKDSHGKKKSEGYKCMAKYLYFQKESHGKKKQECRI